MEDEIRCKIEEIPIVKESKEVIKKIYLESIKMNFQAESNVPMDHPQRDVAIMIERTQVMDTIFLKYNLKQFDLTRAVA